MKQLVSVIIPTLNRADMLFKALQSLTVQTLSPSAFEVVVVDNGSGDHTKETVDFFSSKLKSLRYIYASTPGLHVGRHRGMHESSGELLVFADDDIRATPTWLESIKGNFDDSSVVMVGGNNYPDFGGLVPKWLNRLWERPMFGGHAIVSLSVISLPQGRREIDPYLIWGCNFAVRKNVVLDAGGFHPDGMPQELIRFRGDGESHIANYVATNRLRCVYDSRASVFHAVIPERMTFDYFRRRAFNQGISDSYTKLRKSMVLQDHKIRGFCDRVNDNYFCVKEMVSCLLTGNKDLADVQLAYLDGLTRKSYCEGYKYHQKIYLEDNEVKKWVHKNNYF